jgi:hypothetical protein
MESEELDELLAELAALAVQGAHQSIALGELLKEKGLVTKEELDSVMQPTGSRSQRLEELLRAIQQRTPDKGGS